MNVHMNVDMYDIIFPTPDTLKSEHIVETSHAASETQKGYTCNANHISTKKHTQFAAGGNMAPKSAKNS